MNRKHTILLVDDDPSVLTGLKRALRKEAFTLLANQSVDAVVSDHRMPGMQGLEFLQHLRQKYPDVTRVLLTCQASFRKVRH